MSLQRLFALLFLLDPLGARALELPALQPSDPLARQILSRQLALGDDGVTGAVRLGSGETVALLPALGLGAATESATGETLKDAVADPGALSAPRPAPGLWTKAPPAKRKPARKAR